MEVEVEAGEEDEEEEADETADAEEAFEGLLPEVVLDVGFDVVEADLTTGTLFVGIAGDREETGTSRA